jgi:hypothetical protein
MSNFAIFAFTWPVVGTVLLCAFGLVLARRDRVLYERYQADEARRHGQDPVHPPANVRKSGPIQVDA